MINSGNKTEKHNIRKEKYGRRGKRRRNTITVYQEGKKKNEGIRNKG